ncbi:MAG: hypothetical protein ACNA8J_04535 [Gammaproteobacteria bacterium]
MFRACLCCSFLLLASTVQAADAEGDEVENRNLGMSIVGNHEAPKSLVIVPWKSSELGAETDLSRLLDEIARPVDRDVFARELEYFRIRSE